MSEGCRNETPEDAETRCQSARTQCAVRKQGKRCKREMQERDARKRSNNSSEENVDDRGSQPQPHTHEKGPRNEDDVLTSPNHRTQYAQTPKPYEPATLTPPPPPPP